MTRVGLVTQTSHATKLIVEQMRGNYKVKHEGLKPLYLQARLLVMQIGGLLASAAAASSHADA